MPPSESAGCVGYPPVPIALLLMYTSPILVVVWVWLVRHQRPSRLSVLAV
jgi:drug/metabolite transporter (DMT)-like permease